jgi:acido-empty-quinoprotein group A
MRRTRAFLIAALAAVLPLGLLAQGPLDPAVLTKPPTDAWPTYHGDYSGRHFSTLKEINTTNVRGLSLAWIYHTTGSSDGAILGGLNTPLPVGRGGGPPQTGTPAPPVIKALPLMVNGILYLSTPNHLFAVDARTGAQIWHYVWRGRNAIGNRGVGMLNDALFLVNPDNSVVSLDATTGKERWSRKLTADDATNWSTAAPIVVKNHVLVGIGGDSGGSVGFLESLDPETGASQWRWYSTPRAGEPGIETWPSPEAAARGAGAPWQPPTYDPELDLVYVPTGQATPTYNGKSRPGSNLYTCSIVALHLETGKMAWYYQTSPHDTHDWDATEVTMLIDGTINGQPRKLLGQTNRNGYFFLLDRTNGRPLVVQPYALSNSYRGVDNGVLVPNPDKEGSPGGTLVFPTSDGAVNFPVQSFSPETGLVYVNATDAASVFYLTPDPNDPTGYGRGSEWHTDYFQSRLMAIDYRTGEAKWVHRYAQRGWGSSQQPGLLSTAGGLVFSGDPSGNFIAFDATNGKILWHSNVGGQITNSAITYTLDGHQYVLVAAQDSLFAFHLQ